MCLQRLIAAARLDVSPLIDRLIIASLRILITLIRYRTNVLANRGRVLRFQVHRSGDTLESVTLGSQYISTGLPVATIGNANATLPARPDLGPYLFTAVCSDINRLRLSTGPRNLSNIDGMITNLVLKS